MGFVTSAGQLGRAATLCGKSELPDLSFTKTVYVADQRLRNTERLQRHGSVVVELSGRWRYEHDQVGGWLQFVLNETLRIVTALPESEEEEPTVSHGFDETLAPQILQLLIPSYQRRSPEHRKSPSHSGETHRGTRRHHRSHGVP